MKKFKNSDVELFIDAMELDMTKMLFSKRDLKLGMNTELEHGTKNPLTNITYDDPILTGKIALAHLLEYPNYYSVLLKMERSLMYKLNKNI